MPLPENIRVPLVDDQTEGFDEPIQINSESLAAAGFYPQNATSTDGNAGVYRDSNGNLVLKDANAGVKTLTALSNGGVSFGSPVTVGTVNADGTAATAARSDHVHAHGSQTDGTLHAAATGSVAGFMSAADKSRLDGATDANTASTLVARDASGNFSAGTITATLSGNASTATSATSATTATKLSSSRTFALTGNITGSVSSDLTSGVSIVTTHGDLGGAALHAAASTTTNGFMSSTDKSKLDSVTVANIPTADQKAALAGTSGNSPTTTNRFVDNLDSRMTNARTPTTHAASHGSGGTDPITVAQSQVTNLTTDLAAKAADNAVVHLAGTETITGTKTFSSTITGSISGNAATATSATSATNATNATNVAVTDETTTNATHYPLFVAGTSGNRAVEVSSTKLTYNPSTGTLVATVFSGALSGAATSAGRLTTARNFAASGDATGTVSSDLTSGATIPLTLASVGTAGTYGSASQVPVMTTDAKGRVTGVTNTNIAIAQSAVTNLTTDLSNRPTGSGTAGQVAYWSSASALTSESALQWDATNNRLGIGVTPGTALDVQATGATTARIVSTSNTGATYPGHQIYQYTGGFGGHPAYSMFAARGSQASPAALANGDYLGAFVWNGANTGLTFSEAARMSVVTDATPGASNVNGAIIFNTSANGTSTERVRIDGSGVDVSNGSVAVNGGTLAISSGSIVNGFLVSSSTGSNEGVGLFYKRTSAGSTITSASVYLQRGVPFGSTYGHLALTGSGGVSLGSNNSDYFSLDSSGNAYLSGRLNVGSSDAAAAPLHTRATNENLRMQGNDPWFTFYTSGGTRKGWVGYGDGASTTNFTITNESGGIRFAPAGGNPINCTGNTVPNANNTYQLGTSGQAWSQVWCNAGAFNTSDARAKTDIQDSQLGLSFIEALRPVSYKFKVGQYEPVKKEDGTEELVPRPGVRPHQGFLAQEVKAVMDAQGIADFAGYGHDAQTDTYALRYEEFVAPLTKAVQELSAQVKTLQAELAALKAKS